MGRTIREISSEIGWSYNVVRNMLVERGYLGPGNDESIIRDAR
jgi:hypothetical protein